MAQPGLIRYTPAMSESPNIAALAAPLADPARALMVTLLMDGRARTVTELGHATGLTKASASEHVARLEAAGFLRAARQGRHKYLTLASPEVARLIESMMALAQPAPPTAQTFGPRDAALREARLCYNHLAGSLGVKMYRSFSQRDFLAHQPGGLDLTPAGHAFCQSFGLSAPDLAPTRAPLCRDCLDWSERQSHLGGRLGRLLLARMEVQGWFRRHDGSRALSPTPEGRRAFAAAFPVP
jgi:DNA-binding transcriptional ArsR family regulator